MLTATLNVIYANTIGSKTVWSWLLIFCAAILFTHLVVCVVFGLSIGLINPFLFKIYNIGFTSKRFSIRIKSIRLVFSITSWSKFLIVLDGVDLVLHNSLEKQADVNPIDKTEKEDVPSTKGATTDFSKLNRERPVCIFSENYFLRKVTQYYLLYFRFIGIQLFNVNVNYEAAGLALSTDSLLAKASMKKIKNKFHFKFATKMLQQSINNLEVYDTLLLDISGNLDIHDGTLSKIKLDYELRNLSVPVLSLLKLMNKLKADKISPQKEKAVKDEEYYVDMLYKRLCLMTYFVKLVEEISISFHGISLSQIPLANTNIVHCPDYNPLVLFELKVNSFVCKIQRMYFDSPGYGLSYLFGDKPYHMVNNFTGISLLMENTKMRTTKEVISVPVMNFTGSSNHVFQVVEASKASSSQPTLSKAIFMGHVSEPVIDFSTDDIATTTLSAFQYLKHQHILKTKHPEMFSRSDDSSHSIKWSILKKYSNLWPTLQIKLGIENPVVMLKSSFDDEFYRIILLKLSSIKVEFKSLRDFKDGGHQYFTREKIDLNEIRLQYRNNQTGDEVNVFRSDSVQLRQKIDIIPTVSFETSMNLNSTKVNFSDLNSLHGVNYVFNELKKKIHPLYIEFKQHTKRFDCYCSHTHQEESFLVPEDELDTFDESASILQLIDTIIPFWAKSVKFTGQDVTILLGSRSLLISKELLKVVDTQTKNDLINGELRKVEIFIESYELGAIFCDQSNDNENSSSGSSLEDDDKGLLDTASDFALETARWKASFDLKKVVGKISSEKSTKRDQLKEKVFLKLPNFSVKLSPCSEDGDKIILDCDLSKVEIFYSVMSHFIVISTLHLIRNTVFEFLLNDNVDNTDSDVNLQITRPKARRKSSVMETPGFKDKLIKSLQFNLNLEFFDLIMVMPDDLKMRLELTRLSVLAMGREPILVNAHYTRLCAESPTAPGYWSRIVTAVDGSASINIETILNKEDDVWFNLSNDSCHLTVPHQFIIYKLFQNISIMFKTLKQLHHSLKFNTNDFIINPHVEDAKRIPKVNLKSNRLIFSMDDDPFESELNMIFQIGLLEQKMRHEKVTLLEKKIQEQLQTSRNNVEKSGTFSSSKSKETSSSSKFKDPHTKAFLKQFVKTSHDSKSLPSLTIPGSTHPIPNAKGFAPILELKDQATEKVEKLREHFSKSWISRVKNYRKNSEQEFQANFKYLWGNVDIKQLPKEFDRKVLSFVTNPSLFNLILESPDLDLSQPSCGIDNIPTFINEVGKGVPKDTEYSTLIPVHMDLKLGELRCHLRDYPLPLIHMPATTKKQPRLLPAVRLHGDLVIAEAMIQSQKEIRTVFVPLVPGCKEIDGDSCYSIEVPKTLTSIKFFTNLDWEMNSVLDTKFTWGTSYQPCIQQIMLNLDNFTKPPIDPSEKVGFWDKIRVLFHARMNFNWNYDSQFQICFKGSKNPYGICGLDSGFVLSFKEKVVLAINRIDDPKEFFVVKSEKISFDVPNFIAEPLLVWSRDTSDAVLLSDFTANFQHSSFAYYLGNFSKADVAVIEALKKDRIEKSVITLSGGVEFKWAIDFERKAENGERNSKFIPHYDVYLANPDYIDDLDTYDAYRGFRSNYIHMGFTLISTGAEAYNTIQLTPAVFRNFFAWWKMFSNTLSVRHGQLFGPENPTKKFARHLYTIKYQAILEPLFISHVYHDSEEVHNNVVDVQCVGLKGRAAKFLLDLHQRKELTFDHNTTLDITKRSMKMKFNVGKVDIEDLDLRTLKGLFTSADRNDADGSLGNDHTNSHKFSAFDDDLSWLDITDFREISQPYFGEYKSDINIYPLLHTPKFIYNKRNGYGDKHQIDFETSERIRPFGHENFHDCELESRPLEEVQKECLDKRLSELNQKLADNLEDIDKYNGVTLSPHQKQHVSQLKVDNEQLRHGIKFVSQLRESYIENETSDSAKEEAPFDFLAREQDTISKFTNGFTLHNMLLKWNDVNRDIVYRFIYLFELNGKHQSFLKHKSLQQLDEAIELQRRSNLEGEILTNVLTRATTYETQSSKASCVESLAETRVSEKLRNFEEELREAAVPFFYKTHDNYQLKFVSPQIQLQSENDPCCCVLVVSPNIELNVIALDANETEDDYNENIFEQRFGAVLKDASIFMFYEDEVLNTGKLFFSPSSYGSNTSWPPWLGVELCYDGSLISDHVLMEKTSVIVRYDKIVSAAYIGADDDNLNKLSCDLSQAVFTCDARQYYGLYNIVMHLLIYNDPIISSNKERESKMMFRLDFSDLAGIRRRIVQLQESIKQTDYIINNLVSRRNILDEFSKDDLKVVVNARREASVDLNLLMHVSLVGERKATHDAVNVQEWNIRADDIKMHMLEESRKPFLDVILFNSHFTRFERSDRSDRNIINIQNLEVINLDKQSQLPVVFSSHKIEKKVKKKAKIIREVDDPPLIHILWHMDSPVGGIRVMKKFDVDLQPVQISLEETTGIKILNYAFPDQTPTETDSDSDELGDYFGVPDSPSTEKHHNGFNVDAIKSKMHDIALDQSETMSLKSDLSRKRSLFNRNPDLKDDNLDSILLREETNISSKSDDSGVSEMVKRASEYLSFVSFKFKSVIICVTFRGNGTRRLINVSDFLLTLPEISFTNRTYTLLDLTMHIKKVVIKSLLSHAGSILGNKLTGGKNKDKKPLNSISGYASNRIQTFRD